LHPDLNSPPFTSNLHYILVSEFDDIAFADAVEGEPLVVAAGELGKRPLGGTLCGGGGGALSSSRERLPSSGVQSTAFLVFVLRTEMQF
jgi:hypothetical protein